MLTKSQITTEVDNLIDLISYHKSDEMFEWHSDKGSESNYSVLVPVLSDLVHDAADRNGLSPAYVIGYLALRVFSQSDDVIRDEISKVFNFNGLDGLHWDLGKIKQLTSSPAD